MTTHPPLDPARVRERKFYHYRKRKLIEVLTMSDALALWRIEHGQDLWPVEWGMKENDRKAS